MARKFNLVPLTLAWMSILLLAAGCASPSRVSLDPAKKNGINSAHGIVGLSQQEIVAEIDQSNLTQAAGGGLLFALIDAGINNSRVKDAETDIVPVRDALIGYDVGATLKTNLDSSLQSTPWLKLGAIDIRQLPDQPTLRSWLPASQGNVVVMIRPYYRLTANFDGMIISALVAIQGPPPDDETSQLGAPLYANTLGCVVVMPGGWPGEMPRPSAASLWAANSGLKARQALDEGLSEIARMLAYDLEQSNPPEKKIFKAPEGSEIRFVPISSQPANQGHVVHTENDHVWLRLPMGELYSLRK